MHRRWRHGRAAIVGTLGQSGISLEVPSKDNVKSICLRKGFAFDEVIPDSFVIGELDTRER